MYLQFDQEGQPSASCRKRIRALFLTPRALILAIVLSIATFYPGFSIATAQSDEGGVINREYAIKAAYLYQFGHYIQWPSDAFTDDKSPFVIGILGTDPFGDTLNEIARDKKIGGRQIVIRQFNSLADYKPCHILFIASPTEITDQLRNISKLQNFPVLLVGERHGFAEQGGTINLLIEQNKVRFEVNTEVAKREQLKISSKLLSLAKIAGSP
jgi:hypothetical protein